MHDQRRTDDAAKPDVPGGVGRFVWEKAVMGSGLKSMTRLAGLVLATHMNGQGAVARCWPSIATVADEMGCSRSTASDHISTLVEAGYLVRESKGGGTRSDGRGITTTYIAVVPVKRPAVRTVPAVEEPSSSADQPSGSEDQPSGSPDTNSPQNSPQNKQRGEPAVDRFDANHDEAGRLLAEVLQAYVQHTPATEKQFVWAKQWRGHVLEIIRDAMERGWSEGAIAYTLEERLPDEPIEHGPSLLQHRAKSLRGFPVYDWWQSTLERSFEEHEPAFADFADLVWDRVCKGHEFHAAIQVAFDETAIEIQRGVALAAENADWDAVAEWNWRAEAIERLVTEVAEPENAPAPYDAPLPFGGDPDATPICPGA